MHFAAMDETRLTVLMIAGGIFSMAGILLMFRAKQEGSSARLELFGQKFEATSTGIVVFLIGAAFLASPMFVPERPSAAAPPSGSTVPSKDGSSAELNEQGSDVQLPKPADKEESEKNDSISVATVLDVGQTVHGQLRPGDIDWYAVAVNSNGHEFLHVVFRRLSNSWFNYTILDGNEKVVKGSELYYIADSHDIAIESDKYFIRIASHNDTAAKYELALTYK